jgi:hypothetical protein
LSEMQKSFLRSRRFPKHACSLCASVFEQMPYVRSSCWTGSGFRGTLSPAHRLIDRPEEMLGSHCVQTSSLNWSKAAGPHSYGEAADERSRAVLPSHERAARFTPAPRCSPAFVRPRDVAFEERDVR